jgi:L-iditol 2-dehydrogenase
MIMRLAKLSGASPVFAVDQFPWRLDAAFEWGADTVINFRERNPIKAILEMTEGHGVAVVLEAAWAGEAVAQAVEMADLGARVVLVGIPGEDDFCCKHSTARRKGLNLVMCRRMKHIYGRAISLASSGAVNLESVVSHRFDLTEAPQAFALNAAYEDKALKVMINWS